MSQVYKIDDQYFRVEIAEIISASQPDKPTFVAWCSEGFADLKRMPREVLSRFVDRPPQSSIAEAQRQALEWIKANREPQAKPVAKKRDLAQVMYTVTVFQATGSMAYEFEDIAAAKSFAAAAEKSSEAIKVAITNNESPQYLTVWERGG